MKIYMLYHRDLVLPTEKYYVYIHRNPLTHKIFYVGSAKGNPLRAYEFGKHRNQSWKNEVISFGGTCNIIVEIVQYCEDPIQAQEAEFRLIYKLKKCGEAYRSTCVTRYSPRCCSVSPRRSALCCAVSTRTAASRC